MTSNTPPARVRREPPRFRTVAVAATQRLSPRMVRVTLAGDELAGLAVDAPAASVRLLLPALGSELVMPQWNGNEFRLPDGRRPVIRTFTPRRADAVAGELDIDVVLHGEGAASRWAATVVPGAVAAVSGPGRGYVVDLDATDYLLAGDETAIPAITQLLETLPPHAGVDVHIEVGDPRGRLALPERPSARVSWHDQPDGQPPGAAVVDAVRGAAIAPGTRVWVAGEAAAVQRVRRHLFDERAVPRDHTFIRGYWKQGRASDDTQE